MQHSALFLWCLLLGRQKQCSAVRGEHAAGGAAGQRALLVVHPVVQSCRARRSQGSDAAGAAHSRAMRRVPAESRSAGCDALVLNVPLTGKQNSAADWAGAVRPCSSRSSANHTGSFEAQQMQLSKQIIWLSSCCSGTALTVVALPVLRHSTSCSAQSVLQRYSRVAAAQSVLQRYSRCFSNTARVEVAQPELQLHSCPCCSGTVSVAVI